MCQTQLIGWIRWGSACLPDDKSASKLDHLADQWKAENTPPSVANDAKSIKNARHPELADLADNVIPSRGKNAGHVRKYHPSGTRAGSSGELLNRVQLKIKNMNGN